MNSISTFDEHARRYDDWFVRNEHAYESEILALRSLCPTDGTGLEIGVGGGRFAEPLGIHTGIEPSHEMAKIARDRGIETLLGTGEKLPFSDSSFDWAVMVTTICFLNSVTEALDEAVRVLKPGGSLLLGFVDRDSELGQQYLEYRDRSLFYSEAIFYSVPEILELMKNAGFSEFRMCQTLFDEPKNLKKTEPVKEGWGQGAFVAVKGVM